MASEVVSESDTTVILRAGPGGTRDRTRGAGWQQRGHGDVGEWRALQRSWRGDERFFSSVGQAGTLVTINGTQLLGGGVSVASVTMAGVAVAHVGGQSD